MVVCRGCLGDGAVRLVRCECFCIVERAVARPAEEDLFMLGRVSLVLFACLLTAEIAVADVTLEGLLVHR
jgi:hypothetical protein